MKVDEPPVVVEETFNAPVEEVWNAITEIEQMRKWFFNNIPDFKPRVGFETQFTVSNEGRDFPHLWKIIEVDHEKRIAYNWKYKGYDGDSDVVFELSRDGDGTRLKVSCIVKEDFPDDIPEFERESCLGGWKYFISDSLKAFLEKSS